MPWFMIHPIREMRNGVIFVDIGKSASTTTVEVFGEAVRKSGGKYGGMHMPATFIRDNYKNEFANYHKFAIIRNPLDRFVSLFLFHKGNRVEWDFLKTEKKIREAMKTKGPQANVYATTMICDEGGVVIVDQLLDYDNLVQEVGSLIEEQKIPYVDASLYHKVCRQKTERKKHWSWYYEEHPELRGMVERLYDRDIELWTTVKHSI